MNVRYVTRDIEWTDGMQAAVWTRIIEPLRHCLKTDAFDLTVNFQASRKRMQSRKPEFEMWVVLQTYNGRANHVIRCEGAEFYSLVTEISALLRLRIRKASAHRRRFFENPFNLNRESMDGRPRPLPFRNPHCSARGLKPA